jgi:hypothetical protein
MFNNCDFSRTNRSPVNDFIIDSTRIGEIRICNKISELSELFKSTSDTTLEGDEEVSWKGKLINLPDDEWILVEASWIDSTSIWRITTNSKKYTTINGYKVGDHINKIKLQQDKIEYSENGVPAFEVKSKNVSFWVTIESKYSDDFYQRIEKQTTPIDNFEIIDSNSTIQTITISGSCKNRN